MNTAGRCGRPQDQRLRNRRAAHQMRRKGRPVADIAAHLEVSERSVMRYLAEPCPNDPAAAKPVQLADFHLHGACRGRLDIEWTIPETSAQVDAAKQVCTTQCLVVDDCRAYGLTTGVNDHGIYGGLTRAERRAIAKRGRVEEVA